MPAFSYPGVMLYNVSIRCMSVLFRWQRAGIVLSEAFYTQVAVIIFMTLACVMSYAVYMIPYEFVFWMCDAALGTMDNRDKFLYDDECA